MMDSAPDYQAAAQDLVGAFEVHDRLGQAHAAADQREEQRQARMVLFNYRTTLWQDLKRAGEHPGGDPQYAPIAALRDLAGGLVQHAYVDPPTGGIVNPDEDTSSWDTRRFARHLGVLGERVRAIRRSHGWSQQYLGDGTGIGRAKVSGIEGGKQNLTLEPLWRLADVFQMHWADLLDDRTTAPPRRQHTSVPFDQQLKAFGTRLYQARVLQRLSQQALTGRTAIGRSAISEIEDGKQNVTLETLSRLAAGLGVHWADLLDDRQASPPQPSRACEDDGSTPGASAGEREPEFQKVVQQVTDAFDCHDQPGLAELSAVQLHRHLFARRLLSDYLDQLWHDAQRHGHNPTQQPEWTSVVALRDLAHHLLATARNEQMRRD